MEYEDDGPARDNPETNQQVHLVIEDKPTTPVIQIKPHVATHLKRIEEHLDNTKTQHGCPLLANTQQTIHPSMMTSPK
jgi:hypothetical protein